MASNQDWLKLILEAYRTHNALCDIAQRQPTQRNSQLQFQSWYRFWRRLREANDAALQS